MVGTTDDPEELIRRRAREIGIDYEDMLRELYPYIDKIFGPASQELQRVAEYGTVLGNDHGAKKVVFLKIFDRLRNVARACIEAKISTTTFYVWQDQDPEFLRLLQARGYKPRVK